MMRTLITAALLALTTAPAQTGFMGHWNMTGTGNDSGVVYWLAVSEEGGVVKGRFLNRASSPYDLSVIKIENGELIFHVRDEKTPQLRAKLVDGKLIGTTTTTRNDGTTRVINWVGVRPPKWAAANANGPHTFGKPVVLVDGTSLDGFGLP